MGYPYPTALCVSRAEPMRTTRPEDRDALGEGSEKSGQTPPRRVPSSLAEQEESGEDMNPGREQRREGVWSGQTPARRGHLPYYYPNVHRAPRTPHITGGDSLIIPTLIMSH